ncbi:hypothetical protein D3C81_1795270 [compost metagenome]
MNHTNQGDSIMALNDKKVLKGEPATVVFEINCIKTPKTGRELRLKVWKLDNAPMWVFVANDFIQDTYADFESAVQAATGLVLTC